MWWWESPKSCLLCWAASQCLPLLMHPNVCVFWCNQKLKNYQSRSSNKISVLDAVMKITEEVLASLLASHSNDDQSSGLNKTCRSFYNKINDHCSINTELIWEVTVVRTTKRFTRKTIDFICPSKWMESDQQINPRSRYVLMMVMKWSSTLTVAIATKQKIFFGRPSKWMKSDQ